MPTVFTRRSFDLAIRPLRSLLVRQAAAQCGAQNADDLVQQALTCAWSVITRFDADQPSAHLLVWLRRFVGYACDDFQRHAVRHPAEAHTSTDLSDVIEVTTAAASTDLYLAYRTELRTMLATVQLTSRQSECLYAWFEGLTHEEIGHKLDLTPKTVWEHIEAAKRRLRRWKRSEAVMVKEAYLEDQLRTVYYAPEPTGAALAREQLARLAARDARNAAICRKRAKRPLL